MFLANKQNTCSNAFSCNRYCVFCFARDDMDFAETLSDLRGVRTVRACDVAGSSRETENTNDRCITGSDSASGFVAPLPLNASTWRRGAPVQMFPVNARMITIKRISPNPPLGQYPQPPLYGQAGSAPTKSRIRMINRMVPMGSSFPALCSSTRRILDALKHRRPEGRSRRAGSQGVSTSFLSTRMAYSSGLTSRPDRSAYTWVNSAPNNRICDE